MNWLIVWGAPEYRWLFVLCVILLLFIWYRVKRQTGTAKKLDKNKRLLTNYSKYKVYSKVILSSFGILALFIALLHPRWGRLQETVEQRGRDIFIALDTSRSMLAQDTKPNRLHCAQQALKLVLNKLASDRVSIILFCDKARTFCPLTRDKELACMFIDTVQPSSMSLGTTCVDQPIYKAIEQCKRCPQHKSRLLIIATDGEDFSGSLDAARSAAQQAGLTLLILGVGTQAGSPIALYDDQNKLTGYVKDANNHVVISKLNESALTHMAQQTGGIYCTIDRETPLVDTIVKSIEHHEKEHIDQCTVSSLQEQYPWFLLISFCCFVLEWIL